jgi:hypothetical protein
VGSLPLHEQEEFDKEACRLEEGTKMTWFARWVGYSIGWSAKQLGVDPFLPWYVEAGSELALGAASAHPVTSPYMKAAATRTGQFAIQHALRPAAVRTAAATGTLALYGAAAGVGYAAGAVVGTGISHALFGEAGARDALEFYSGQVSFDQYFEVVGEALGTL